ncbi:MAG: phosphopentomutase [Chloroflexi bacterium]|nr:phosphopentomutase [Chloroflexota bacterium]
MNVNRVIVIVLDSVGIGELPDAAAFGDVGSNTLGNIARVTGGLNLPNLEKMGLANIAIAQGVNPQIEPTAAYGRMAEVSPGKDTTTGHWELMGVQLKRPFPTYPNGFPPGVIGLFEGMIGMTALGNYPASGTVIIEELGAEHMRTGQPIVYTSADSVFQIAAHEETIPIDELYEMCQTARDILRGEHEVGRVIARPFIGEPGQFTRTANRHDYSVVPPEPTLLDNLKEAGLMTYAVGKINDIFAKQGVTDTVSTADNMDGVTKTVAAMRNQADRGLIFTNLVDFDAKFGHRNNPRGYRDALEAFDRRLPEILDAMNDDDILIITADHGNDPTFPGTDHTREYVPILIAGKPALAGANIGVRASFADLAATIADTLGVEPTPAGQSFKKAMLRTLDKISGPPLQAWIEDDPTRAARIIDHTLLKANATQADVAKICDEAKEYNFASVCVNAGHVPFVADQLEGTEVKTCAVVGFPLGATLTSVKATEAVAAIMAGADEIDMVINVGALKAKDDELVEEDITAVVDTAHAYNALCKVIIETSYLTDEEKERVCRMAVRVGADYVKTSTGFSGGGATVEDVALMRRVVGDRAGVKASGGVRGYADAMAMVEAGANRIGASSGVKIVQKALAAANY